MILANRILKMFSENYLLSALPKKQVVLLLCLGFLHYVIISLLFGKICRACYFPVTYNFPCWVK